MVLLCMGKSLIAALKEYEETHALETLGQSDVDPDLNEPAVGKPISHGQILNLASQLEKNHLPTAPASSHYLNDLLKGCAIYVEAKKVKPEPTLEYKLLMAQLRKDDEARQYQRMVIDMATARKNPFSVPAQALPGSETEADEMTYADVNRQMALIVNVLISIIACSISIWIAARHWAIPARLALSMSGSGLVAVAEVAVYFGYIRKLYEARDLERKKVETKTISETWVIGARPVEENVLTQSARVDNKGVRARKTFLTD